MEYEPAEEIKTNNAEIQLLRKDIENLKLYMQSVHGEFKSRIEQQIETLQRDHNNLSIRVTEAHKRIDANAMNVNRWGGGIVVLFAIATILSAILPLFIKT